MLQKELIKDKARTIRDKISKNFQKLDTDNSSLEYRVTELEKSLEIMLEELNTIYTIT